MTAISARIIRDHVVNEIIIAGIGELVRFARAEEKRVAQSDLGPTIFVTHLAAPGNNQIKFRLARVRMIRAKRFAFRNAYERKIERMPFAQIERLRIVAEFLGMSFRSRRRH